MVNILGKLHPEEEPEKQKKAIIIKKSQTGS